MMLAFLYPTPSGPTPVTADPWLTLAITGVVLVALVLFTWAAMRRHRPEAEVSTAGPSARIPKAA